MTIYFSSEENRDGILSLEMSGSGGDLPGPKKIFDDMAKNSDTGAIN